MTKLGHVALNSLLLVSGTTLLSNSKAYPQAPSCVTWTQARKEFQSLYSQSFGAKFVPEIPKGFRKGCVFGDNGAYIIAAYILKDNLSPSIVRTTGKTLLDTSVPQLQPDRMDNIQQLLSSGRALLIYNVCSSTGTIHWCDKIPKDRPYFKDGAACLQNLCMRTVGVPKAELMKLWGTAD